MRKLSPLTLGTIAVFFLTACGSNSSGTTVDPKDSLTNKEVITENISGDKSVSETTQTKDGAFCFEKKFKEPEGTFTCTLKLIIKEGKVTATTAGEWEGCGGSSYKGYQNGDTLFLKDSFEEPDGTIVETESLWLLEEDKLSQFTTAEKKGRAVLKNPTKPTFVLTYNKVNCK